MRSCSGSDGDIRMESSDLREVNGSIVQRNRALSEVEVQMPSAFKVQMRSAFKVISGYVLYVSNVVNSSLQGTTLKYKLYVFTISKIEIRIHFFPIIKRADKTSPNSVM